MRTDRLRAINTPRRVEVELGAAGLPMVVERCAVESVGEIWRIDDEWWRQPISRRYIEVILGGGKHVVLFQDLTTGEWWVQKP
jgi:hypothetical protein